MTGHYSWETRPSMIIAFLRIFPHVQRLYPRLHMKGWGAGVVFDGQTAGGMSSDVRLQSPDYDSTGQRYDIEASGTGSMITVTAG